MTVEKPVVPLLEPRDGLPHVVTTSVQLERAVATLAAGVGPVAIDAERASGYRYGNRAYLVQLRRAGAGTVIIDPDPLRDLTTLGDALADTEWVLHAASQDLPCLSALGLHPHTLFDTELAGRLLSHPRVGLGAITEAVLGYQLEKGHAAVDWSTRPIPNDWLRYAALDVEVLVELRDRLDEELQAAGKSEWAMQEFAALAAAAPLEPRPDPWRRTSGIHRLRQPRQLESVRQLWTARDELARQRDIAPGRILPDAAIIDAAVVQPMDKEALVALAVFGGRATKRTADRWLSALERARQVPDADLPGLALASDAPPPARAWPDRDPEAAARLAVLRPAVAALADEHNVPTENLLTPDTLRRVAWAPPDDTSAAGIDLRLFELGARQWQRELTARPISRALDRVATERSARAAGLPVTSDIG